MLQQANAILLEEIDSGGILRLTLNNPTQRNALCEDMLAKLADALARAKANDEIRVIILASTGNAFCAGHHLKQMDNARKHPDKGRAYFDEILTRCCELMQSIVNHPKPIIAEIAGVATAAGCQLVASCDLAIASEAATFSTPGVHIGLFCSTPMVALSRNIHNKQAMEMLLTGEPISAIHAQNIGLVNKVVPESELTEATLLMASKIASKSMNTLAIGKQAFYQQAEMPLDKAYAFAREVMVDNMICADAEEGIKALYRKTRTKMARFLKMKRGASKSIIQI